MAQEKGSSAYWPDEPQVKGIPAPIACQGHPHQPSRPFRTLTRSILLSIFFLTLTIYIWIVGKYDRSNDGEGATWIVDAFVHYGHGKHGKGGPIRGKAAEKLYLTIPNATSAIAASRQFATKPHMAGTRGDFDTAKDFLALLQREFGITSAGCSEPIYPAGSTESRHATLSIPTTTELKAWIDVYYPVLNTPLDRSLEILGGDGKPAWKANLEEVVDEADPEAYKYADAIPAFHGLSANGEVEGKLVYANYGRKSDYDALVEADVDLNGTIVITRYGGPFRGLKVKGAQELGAVGVLIYSDLRDDGTVIQENGYVPYPHGPARSPTSVQRGSVQFISKFPGDPTTPNYPSYENSTRLNGTNYPTIPSLPISAATAEILLKEIENGGNNRIVRLVNHGNFTPIWNAYGLIPGHIKDEVIVVGNHRDAWVMGATDPSSGTASVHEVVRGLGALLKSGWKPLRSILIASWDAEEYGLIGSTEWGEDFPEFIGKNVVAYLNLDSANSGSRFRASASPSLAHFVRDTAEEIPHPTEEGRTLWDARFDTGSLFGEHIDKEVLAMQEEKIQTDDSLGVGALGSGSDYTVFLQHIGVACAQASFQSTLHDPVYHYHSVFDSERWQELYGDPGFPKHVAVAQHLGLQILRMSDALILPLNTTHYSYELENYLDRVESIVASSFLDVDLSSLRKSIQLLQAKSIGLDAEKQAAEHKLKKLIKKWRRRHSRRMWFKRHAKKLACRLAKFLGMESRKCSCRKQKPSVTTAGGKVVKPRVGRLASWLQELTELREGHLAYGYPSRKFIKAVKRVRTINQKLIAFERGFISEEGIPDREWYRHLGVAPGKWLGYGATTFPALTESLTLEKNSTLAAYEADRLTRLIKKLVQEIQV
ncbi:hypothetical protein PILCRDRAFT_811656 [Piloderma croceum F 1598]|uniref:Zn-dependent exopeptidase n=1 Tax=Piloderma croceum (strain F 1598) TaxID=765440 RepID=A0A0C3CNA0_PILCF|nr:hypothetical protein PILCRDRAFT_811656 [Piloderma croceum F 1598]